MGVLALIEEPVPLMSPALTERPAKPITCTIVTCLDLVMARQWPELQCAVDARTGGGKGEETGRWGMCALEARGSCW